MLLVIRIVARSSFPRYFTYTFIFLATIIDFNGIKLFFNYQGKFYSSSFKDQSVLALCTDSQNKMLFSGDTLGFVYIWNIVSYRLVYEEHTANNPSFMPSCKNAWRAHDSAIVSIEYLSRANGVYTGELLLTASSDWTCRLWDLSGLLIGTFGQEKKWNLKVPRTFHSNIMAEIEKQIAEGDEALLINNEEEDYDLGDEDLDIFENAFEARDLLLNSNNDEKAAFLPKITSSYDPKLISKSKELSSDFFTRPSTIYSEPERVETINAPQTQKPKAGLGLNQVPAPNTGRNHNDRFSYLENIRRFKLNFDLESLGSKRFIQDEPKTRLSVPATTSMWKLVARNRAKIVTNNPAPTAVSSTNGAIDSQSLKLPSIHR